MRNPPNRQMKRHYPKLAEPLRFPAKPHALPWVTKEMLTGARAPVAKTGGDK